MPDDKIAEACKRIKNFCTQHYTLWINTISVLSSQVFTAVSVCVSTVLFIAILIDNIVAEYHHLLLEWLKAGWPFVYSLWIVNLWCRSRTQIAHAQICGCLALVTPFTWTRTHYERWDNTMNSTVHQNGCSAPKKARLCDLNGSGHGWKVKASRESHDCINPVRSCEEIYFKEALEKRDKTKDLIKVSIGENSVAGHRMLYP